MGLKRGSAAEDGAAVGAFSILERIVGVETAASNTTTMAQFGLSVSSNGSLGLKPQQRQGIAQPCFAFSILERIVGVETELVDVESLHLGETFSILERIVGVETPGTHRRAFAQRPLSVSSNGSLGLKHDKSRRADTLDKTFSILERIVGVETRRAANLAGLKVFFQYPRTDRWG